MTLETATDNQESVAESHVAAVQEQAPPAWKVRPLMEVANIAASEFHPEKKWMATKFSVEKPDGTTEEVESKRNVLTIDAVDGTRIEVPAFAVDHIMKLHLKGEEAGSTIEGSMQSSFETVARRLPSKLPFDKTGVAAFEVDVGQPTGTEGVTSRREMLATGVITQEDIAALESVKNEVFRLNMAGTEDEKKAFAEQYNAAHGNRGVKLGVRAGAIAPFYVTDRQPTSKMFVVIGSEKDPDESEHKRVWTMAPGRFMEKLPSDGKYTGRYSAEGIPEGTTVAQLWEKARAGAQLSPEEESLIREQQKAQECWWNGGFIEPPPKSSAEAKPPSGLEQRSEIAARLVRSEAGGVILEIAPDALAAALPEKLRAFPQELKLGDASWRRKDEFHLTWIGFSSGLEKALKAKHPELSNKDARTAMKGILDEAVKALGAPEQPVRPTGEVRRMQKGENQTLIAMCELGPAAIASFEKLRAIVADQFGVTLELPPAHVTLYTSGNEQGIGIASEQQFTEFDRGPVNLE